MCCFCLFVCAVVLFFCPYRYDWLPSERLLELSISDLATTGAVVAIWVTNKRKYARFIQRTLFPKWGVTYLAEWHWLKVHALKVVNLY